MPKGRDSGMPEETYWESFFNPGCIVERLGCVGLTGDVVDFGCGYGQFTVAAARRTTGTVYGLDIESEMIEVTRNRAEAAGAGNVVAERRDFLTHGTGRPDASAAFAMLFNILHIEEPVKLLREAYRILRPGGRAGIIHWKHDPATPRGPDLSIRPTSEQCREWGEAAGFRFVEAADLCCCSWHYGVVLERQAEPFHGFAPWTSTAVITP